MIYILIKDQTAINVDSTEERDLLTQDGWRELTPAEIKAAGMEGYEQFVSPVNTKVVDNKIIFTPPLPPSEEYLFELLRKKRDSLLLETDYFVMPDYPSSESDKKKMIEYRQALRDITGLDGAPWDGGGDNTPWPVLDI